MEDQLVKTEYHGRICILTLNDPVRLNAMGNEMSKMFQDAVAALTDDRRLRVLVITGAGRAFSAGGNLDEIAANYKGDPGAQQKASFEFYNRFLCIRNLDVPVIAAVNGHAVGAGACLALACDMRMAGCSAWFGFPFVKLGLHPGMGAEYLLQHLVGQAKTFELLMTGDLVTAEAALSMGMVNHVVQDTDLMGQTLALAEKIAAMPRLPIRMMKESIPAALQGSLAESLGRQAAYQAINYTTDDFKEGIAALKERRPPVFKDEY